MGAGNVLTNVLTGVQVAMGSSGAVTLAAVNTGHTTSAGGGSSNKKKRSHTEDESETDQLAISKEEDPWALTDHIDASSDYLDTQIAGEWLYLASQANVLNILILLLYL